MIGARAVETLLEHHPDRAREILHSGKPVGARLRILEKSRALGIADRSCKLDELERWATGARHNGVVALAASADYAQYRDILRSRAGLTDQQAIGSATAYQQH